MNDELRIKLKSRNSGGFTLVETLVAIAIFTVSIVALMSVLGSGISNTNYAKQKIIASYLAQEGIEYMRNMRDANVLYGGGNGWNNFKSGLAPCNVGNGCSFDTVFPHDVSICNNPNECKLYINNGSYNTTTGTDSGFVRKIWATSSADEVIIYSKVEWTQGSGNYNITFSEYLFDWIE